MGHDWPEKADPYSSLNDSQQIYYVVNLRQNHGNTHCNTLPEERALEGQIQPLRFSVCLPVMGHIWDIKAVHNKITASALQI